MMTFFNYIYNILAKFSLIYNSLHPTASLLVTVTFSGNNIAGESFHITCTAVINGSSDTPTISWNTTESDETVSYDNGTYSKLLQFDPLQVSHDNTYKCQVEVADIIDEQLFDLTVQSKIMSYKPMVSLLTYSLIQYSTSGSSPDQ